MYFIFKLSNRLKIGLSLLNYLLDVCTNFSKNIENWSIFLRFALSRIA